MDEFAKYYNQGRELQLGALPNSGIRGILGIDADGMDTDTLATNSLNYAMHLQDLDYNWRMAQYQNDYNSPKNQLQRYLDAGLNPALMYGQISPGQMTANLTSQSPRMESGADLKYRRQALDQQMFQTAMGVVGEFLGLASKVEGIRNQSLQNEVIKAQLPSIQASSSWNEFLNLAKKQLYNQTGEFNQTSIEGLGDFGKILFPEYYSSLNKEASAGVSSAREQYQNWWNNNIAPVYQSLQEGKLSKTEAESKIQEYNSQMLESLPPAIRPFVAIITQILGGITPFIKK